MKILTVVSAFGSYERGAQISDADAMASALESHAQHVVPIEVPDPPRVSAVVPIKPAS